jgi:hypothetical protein
MIPSKANDGTRKRPRPSQVAKQPPLPAAPKSVQPTSAAVNTRVIQMVKRPCTVVNHSYVDYSLVPPGLEDIRPEDIASIERIESMDFHRKMHHMLARSDLAEAISWRSHGRAFKIIAPSKFEKLACQEYFGHKRYSSFLYQLGVHGYKKLTAGRDRGSYYSPVRTRPRLRDLTCRAFVLISHAMPSNPSVLPHVSSLQLLLQGLPHLTKYMPDPKEFRHLIQDSDSEPDFYIIKLIAPLPADIRYGIPLTMECIGQFCQKTGRSVGEVDAQLLSL